MCKICTREDFISLLDVGCCCCIYSGFLALECNQFANFRYFAAFANVQVFDSLAFFCSLLVAGNRLFPVLFAIYEYFVLFLHSRAHRTLPSVCLSVRLSDWGGGLCLALFLLEAAPLGYANDAWLPLGSWMLTPLRLCHCHCHCACVFIFACVWVVFWPKVLNLANGVVIFVEIELHNAHTL